MSEQPNPFRDLHDKQQADALREFQQKHGRLPNQPSSSTPGAPAPAPVHPENPPGFDNQQVKR
jgi:hypothetical protein